MFNFKEIADFKQHIRDFLVQTKAFESQDNTALFADEQAQLKEVHPAQLFYSTPAAGLVMLPAFFLHLCESHVQRP